MQSLSRIMISLPLCILPFVTTVPHASAAGFTPSDAVRLLARSRTADQRCRYLSASEHQQLADFVARAEVAAARIDGVSKTKAARTRGDDEGRAMACNAQSKGIVTATLSAARRAERHLGPSIARVNKKAPPKAVAATTYHPPKKERVAALQAPQPAPASAPRNPYSLTGSSKGLGLYTREAAAYYIERRCQFLASDDTMAFWKAIVVRHNAMIARYGGSAVGRAKAKAREAGSSACTSDAESFVRTAWQGMQSNH